MPIVSAKLYKSLRRLNNKLFIKYDVRRKQTYEIFIRRLNIFPTFWIYRKIDLLNVVQFVSSQTSSLKMIYTNDFSIRYTFLLFYSRWNRKLFYTNSLGSQTHVNLMFLSYSVNYVLQYGRTSINQNSISRTSVYPSFYYLRSPLSDVLKLR